MQSFLFVGIGGSGGKTLAYLWRSLDRRLKAAGWTDAMPSIWQFVHIDPRWRNDAPGDDVPVLPAGAVQYVNLADPNLPYHVYDHQLMHAAFREGMAGWRPEPPLAIEDPYLGAGQRRAVGRTIALASLERVQHALSKAAQPLLDKNADGVRAQLRDLFDVPLDYTPDVPAAVVVIGSLAGGSGSGSLVDIVQVVRTLGRAWSDSPLTIFYPSELFENLPADFRRGIHPNALAAACELMAAHEGNQDQRGLALLQRAGAIVPNNGERRTGKNNAIIGMSNGSWSLNTETEVYRTVGNALAGALTDWRVQKELSSFIVNTNGAPFAPGYLLSKHAASPAGAFSNTFGSFGYASFGLGRNLFAQYAAERLAKSALDRLLKGHLATRNADEDVNEQTLITRAADARELAFFNATGLNEAGTEANQVLDALRDVKEATALLDGVRDSVLQRLRESEAGLPPGDMRAALIAQFLAETAGAVGQARTRRDEKAIEWVRTVRAAVTSATAQEIALHGFPTTLELLERLDAQVSRAISDLELYESRFDKEERSLLAQVTGIFTHLRGRITATHPSVAEAADIHRNALQRLLEGDLFQFAGRLLRDVRERLLVPLRASVKAAGATLDSLSSEPGLDRQKFDRWSSTVVPPHLLPAPNEYLLEDASTFPAMLEREIGRIFAAAPQNAESIALAEVISGSWPGRQQTLIASPSLWNPLDVASRPNSGTAALGSFAIQLDADRLLARAEEWVSRRPEMRAFVREPLTNYLDVNGPDFAPRSQAFDSALRSAITASRPLVKINGALDRIVHATEMATIDSFTPIPVAPVDGSALYQKVATALLQGIPTMTPTTIAGLCQPASKAGDCEIVCFTGSSRHPVVFASLMEPIAEEWNRRSVASPAELAQFWSYRRAKVLPDFVPLPYNLQQAMIRGWYTAAYLGYLKDLALASRGAAVWSTDGWLTFPWPYLTGVQRDRAAVLPAVLESYPLSLLELSQHQPSESHSAYHRLLELGHDGGVDRSEYVGLNPELELWIVDGKRIDGLDAAPAIKEGLAGPADGAPQDRAAALLAAFGRPLKEYDELKAPRLVANHLEVDRRWEIAWLVQEALAPLVSLLDERRKSSDEDAY